MFINEAGIKLIKDFESCRLSCYKDLVGLNTIGYGHRTALPVGATITQAEADRLLEADLDAFSAKVDRMITSTVTTNQFSAMVSLAFNIGAGAFEKSTLLKLVNAGDFAAASDEFEKWSKAKGVTVAGLLRRRQAERALFLS